MKKTNIKEFFQKNGYLTVKNFLSSSLISTLREQALDKLQNNNEFTLRPTEFLKCNNFTQIIFSHKFKSILQTLSPEYRFYLPNFTIRNNLYIDWHTDDEYTTTDEEALPKILQCNIYLQDNSIEHGGGIDICLSSHKLSKEDKRKIISQKAVNGTTINIKAGDLLIFDYRAIHRSTIPILKPITNNRMAIQWTVTRSLNTAKEFYAYFMRRKDELLHLSDFTDKRSLSYFIDMQNVLFPQSFSTNSQELVRKNNLCIADYNYLQKESI